MGRRQVVRHLVLVQAFGGSNPSAPVHKCFVRFCQNGVLANTKLKKGYTSFLKQICYKNLVTSQCKKLLLQDLLRGIRTLGTVSRTHD